MNCLSVCLTLRLVGGPSRRRSGPDLTADWPSAGWRKTIGCCSSWCCATHEKCTDMTETAALHAERSLCHYNRDLTPRKVKGRRFRFPTRRAEAAVHVGPVPGLHGAVHRRQRAERPLAGQGRHHDDGLVQPVLVLVEKPRPRPEAWTNHTRLWA